MKLVLLAWQDTGPQVGSDGSGATIRCFDLSTDCADKVGV